MVHGPPDRRVSFVQLTRFGVKQSEIGLDVDKDDVVSELARELCRPSITLDRSLEVILLIVKDAEVVEDEATLGDRAKGLAEAQTLLE